MAPAVPSRGPFARFGEGQAAQVVRSLGCLAAGSKEGPFVGLQELDPGADVARVPNIAIEAKFRTQERGAELRNQFLGRVVARAEPVLQISIEAGLGCRPMRQFMEVEIKSRPGT